MIHSPVKVISKLVTVCSTDTPEMFCVVVYINGKVNSVHMPSSLDEATKLAESLANGDRR